MAKNGNSETENKTPDAPEVLTDTPMPEKSQSGDSENAQNEEKTHEIDVFHVSMTDMQTLFGVSKEAIRQWVLKDCPKNEDGTYQLTQVITWREAFLKGERKSSPASEADLKKANLQNEVLEARLAKIRDETIPRVEAEQLAQSQMIALKSYLTDGWKVNGQFICKELGLPISSLQKLFSVMDRIIREALDVFVEVAERRCE